MFWRSEANTLDPRMITLPELEVDQEEDVCHVLEVRYEKTRWMIRRSVIGLSMLLIRPHSLITLTCLKSLKPWICSDSRRHLKWCQHLSLCLPKPRSMSPSLIKVIILGCKSRFYWDLELSHSMKSESHHPFVPIHYSLVLLYYECLSRRQHCILNAYPLGIKSCIVFWILIP